MQSPYTVAIPLRSQDDATLNDMLDMDTSDSSILIAKGSSKTSRPNHPLKPMGVQRMEAVNAGLKRSGHVFLYFGSVLEHRMLGRETDLVQGSISSPLFKAWRLTARLSWNLTTCQASMHIL
jgi:hypothetical protein